MEKELLRKKYLPMTESAYYILLSLNEPRHGYGIMQHVEEITNGRIKIGPGTIYGTLSKLENEKLIIQDQEIDRKKIFRLSEVGKKVIELELIRLKELFDNGMKEMRGVI
ncbi:PadR family transcriptional regulator [Proteiniclasticum sp.]|uniref:PadR family transcriptional regulator n=1 Tax=Proteiniclasticum sp. TaxID=2053595 RepID=UPI00289683C0|nr:PadR family transcriptional regulator [Proteiniclasticum sp.]